MNRLLLNTAALVRLEAQVRLNGTFQHRLTAEGPHRSVLATVVIEQCSQGIHVGVTHNGTRHSLCVTLDNQRSDNGARVARFIESTVNGDATSGVPDVDEYLLVSDLELMLRTAIRCGRGTYWLPAHELEPELLISRHPRGSYDVQLRIDDAAVQFTLPADSKRAYSVLVDHLRRFLQDYRAAFSAAA